ncbi:MAG: AtpZ/AtpI family protein [Pseudomonadota bacterium]
MSETPDPEKLKDLSARIEAAKASRAPEPPRETKYEKANLAWQMVIELVVGMVIGLLIGWSLDWLLGTLPVFLMIFGLLGFAAGVKTMIGTAKGLNTPPGATNTD